MRIAFICDANNPHVIARIKYLLAAGHEIYYYGLPPEKKMNVPEKANSFLINSNGLFAKFKLFQIIYTIFKIRKLSQIHDIEVLHIMWLGYVLYGFFAKKKKLVYEIMGSDILIFPEKSWIWRNYIKLFFKFSDAVIQDAVVAKQKGLKYGASSENNEVIEVGVDLKYFNPEVEKGVAKKDLGLDPNQKLVFSPRNTSTIYNIDIIIKTIPLVKRKYPEVKYVFCRHKEELSEYLLKCIQDAGCEDQMIFTGPLETESELPYYYMDADVIVSIPSSDTSPRSVTEALACMTPVIVAELPWYENKFEHLKHIYVVPQRNIEITTQAIVEILNGEVSFDLDSSYRLIEQKINQDKANKKLETLYIRLLKEN